jgi:hypothetical protein
MKNFNSVYDAIFEVYDEYEADWRLDLRELVEKYLGQKVEDEVWQDAVDTYYRYKL